MNGENEEYPSTVHSLPATKNEKNSPKYDIYNYHNFGYL